MAQINRSVVSCMVDIWVLISDRIIDMAQMNRCVVSCRWCVFLDRIVNMTQMNRCMVNIWGVISDRSVDCYMNRCMVSYIVKCFTLT